jgi:tetratricopeptide (TPR) repeat protein
VSFNKFIPLVFFSTALFAQMPPAGGELSFSGEIQSNGSTPLNTLYVELYDPRTHVVVERASVSGDGNFRLNHGSADSSYTIRVVTAPGEDPLVEESRIMGLGNSLVLHLPDQKTNQPPAGGVSVHELQHPIPKQAIRAAEEAQRYSEAHDTAKAIAKLEQAIRMAPSFRVAHANLGVEYARARRLDEAVGQFRVALEIGPPDVLIYSNLSLALLTLKQYQEGEEFARKALALEPENAMAQRLFKYAAAHSLMGRGSVTNGPLPPAAAQ